MYSDDRKTIKKDGTLEFKKTEVKDDGEYVCVARLTDGSKTRKKSRKALLTIQSKSIVHKVHFLECYCQYSVELLCLLST